MKAKDFKVHGHGTNGHGIFKTDPLSLDRDEGSQSLLFGSGKWWAFGWANTKDLFARKHSVRWLRKAPTSRHRPEKKHVRHLETSSHGVQRLKAYSVE